MCFRGGIFQLGDGTTVNFSETPTDLTNSNVVLTSDYLQSKDGIAPQYTALGIVDGQVIIFFLCFNCY